MKLTAFAAAVLLGTTALAQTAEPPKPAEPAAKPAEAPPKPAEAPPKPAEPPKPSWTFALHGFASLTGGYQTGTFAPAEGQLSNLATTPATFPDKSSFTFDVRHSRFNFSVKGPPTLLLGATPSGVLEIDFMGGFGAGANGSASLMNRLRYAYAELNWGNHKLWFGQQNDLVFALAPMSLSHIGQPLAYGTGNVGFRRPGVFGFHTFRLPGKTSAELAWEVGRGSWSDTGGGTGVPGNGVGAGGVAAPGITAAEASAGPAFEARGSISYGKILTLFVAGHRHRVDLTGAGNGTTANVNTLTVAAGNAGVKAVIDVRPITITLAGTGFVGQNAGPLNGTLTAGNAVGPNATPDLHSSGYWTQLGLNFTKELSLWGLYGAQWVRKKDFARSVTDPTTKAYRNADINVIAMYRDPSGFAFSMEWINFRTKYPTAVDTVNHVITSSRTARANQYLATANYFF